jgi:predicted transcriptional regulator of viral defense system
MVFCLLTALQIHGLTTQTPHEVWVAISPNAKEPRSDYPPMATQTPPLMATSNSPT